MKFFATIVFICFHFTAMCQYFDNAGIMMEEIGKGSELYGKRDSAFLLAEYRLNVKTDSIELYES